MKRRATAHHSNTFGLAIFIGSLIGLLVICSFIIKVILVFNQSTFDGKHQFIIAIQEPNKTKFIVLNPDDSSIKTLILNTPVASHSLLKFGITSDSVVTTSSDILSVSDLAKNLIFHNIPLKTQMTPIDAMNIFIFSHTSFPSDDISLSSLNSLDDQNNKLEKIFENKTIYDEGESVSVVNGTDVSGLGSEIARLFSNMGVNVVSVTTSPTLVTTSYIEYSGKLTYTVSRLSNILHISVKHMSSPTISDITVVLGTDRVNSLGN